MKAGIAAALGLGLAVTLTLALASCDGEDPVDSALRDASAARHAAAALTTEQQQARSASASAPSGDQALVADLLKAEREARTAAERAQARATDPSLRQLAEAQAADSSARIAALEAWTAAAE
jgi:hypothetical protein